MTEITDAARAFEYGDSLLAGDQVRLRGVRDDEVATLARWEMDAGRSVTLNHRVAPQSEAACRELVAKWSANDGDTLGFAIETLAAPAVLVGHINIFSIRAVHDGHWYDDVLMSVLDHEWAARREASRAGRTAGSGT